MDFELFKMVVWRVNRWISYSLAHDTIPAWELQLLRALTRNLAKETPYDEQWNDLPGFKPLT